MTLPSIELRPGADLDRAISLLQALATNCYVDAAPVGTSVQIEAHRRAYVLWATNTEARLRTILDTRAAAFFDGPRHRDIASMTSGGHLLPMINAEIAAHSDRFRAVADELDLARKLFDGAGICLVPDTSFFIQHDKKLEDVDFHDLTQRALPPVRVSIPMVVVDELDRLKQSNQSKVRWRAGYSLAVMDKFITEPPAPGILVLRNSTRGEVSLQIVFDPPGHQRMVINDDEIVDRALACQRFVEDLTIITYDTGQSQRARAAGLKVKKLTSDLGQEPNA